MENYVELSKVLKAISDPKRLEIMDMLSCGELCACEIQQHFQITQPTLSHDMKVLANAGLIRIRPEGKWNHYSLHVENLSKLTSALQLLGQEKEDCICHQKKEQ